MFQDVSRQNKLSGSCAILFGRSWFTSLVPTDSLQTLGNPQTPAWVRFGGLQPEHLSREEQNLQKPAVFGTDVHQVHGSIRIQAALAQPTDCVMRPSPNIPNAWNYHEINFFGPVVQLTSAMPREEKPRSPSVLPGKVPWGNSELQSAGLEPPPVDDLRENPAAQNSSKICTVTYTSCTNHTFCGCPLTSFKAYWRSTWRLTWRSLWRSIFNMKINIDQAWSTMISKIKSKPKCLTSVRQEWAEHFTFWFIHARTAGKWRRCHAPDFAIHACQATREATHR